MRTSLYADNPFARDPEDRRASAFADEVPTAAAAPLAAEAGGAEAAGGLASGAGAAVILPVIADFLQQRAKDQAAVRQRQANLASQYAGQQGATMWGVQGQNNRNAATKSLANPMDYVALFSKLKKG